MGISRQSLYRMVDSLISLCKELLILINERNSFFKEAKRHFTDMHLKKGSYHDYKKSFWKHRVTYSEYMYSYEFWRLSEKERDKYISTSEMQCLYRKLTDKSVRHIFCNKIEFLKTFDKYIYRKWGWVRDMTIQEFQSMICECDCIAKPIRGTRGNGIFKIVSSRVENWRALYKKCVDDNILLEHCIHEFDELSSFHPSSLNTIRIVTISNNDKVVVFGALFRMGAHGSFIDNTHAGGVYAPINLCTGTIDVSAIDSHNNKYETHPDTGKKIVGFKIPYWKEIIETCKEATQTIPNVRFVGWDVCVNQEGKVEIIEGNYAPDFDGGMQAPLKIGVKQKIADTIQSVYGINPLPFIKVCNFPRQIS